MCDIMELRVHQIKDSTWKKKRIGFIRLLLKEVSSKTFKKANVQASIMKDNIFRNSWKFY